VLEIYHALYCPLAHDIGVIATFCKDEKDWIPVGVWLMRNNMKKPGRIVIDL
jgi:hypothetical protein